MTPIWKDYDAALTPDSNGRAQFSISVNGAVVYTGEATAYGSETCKVRVNDIVADYLTNCVPLAPVMDDVLQEWTDTQCGVLADVLIRNLSVADVISIEVKMDWSYEDVGYKLSDPINGRIDPRMPLIWTAYAEEPDTDIVLECYTKTGDFLYEDYNNDYSGANVHDSLLINVDAGAHNIYLYAADLLGYQWMVREDGQVFKVVSPCHRYALYYTNEYGGVDFLLMEGNCTMQDTLTRSTIKGVYNNATPYTRGKTEYLNEQVRNYTLKTGLLTEAESLKMHHLIGSTCVYLWDNLEQVMRPVVITNTTQEHKTYKGEGRSLIQYTINAELTRDRQRR